MRSSVFSSCPTTLGSQRRERPCRRWHASRLRHPRLNLLNLEAVAAGATLDATLWLSPPAASGLLPAVLDAEGIKWTTITVA